MVFPPAPSIHACHSTRCLGIWLVFVEWLKWKRSQEAVTVPDPFIMDWKLIFDTGLKLIFGSGLLFALWRIYLLQRKYVEDHELARRTKAIDCVLEWSKSLSPKSAAARKLVEAFSPDQCRRLLRQEPLAISVRHTRLVKSVFPSFVFTKGQKEKKLSDDQLMELRWVIISYLNLLESILCARRHGVADPDIIDEEFQYLVSPAEGHFVLEAFRQACGGPKAFPAAQEFVDILKATGLPAPGKPALGRLLTFFGKRRTNQSAL